MKRKSWSILFYIICGLYKYIIFSARKYCKLFNHFPPAVSGCLSVFSCSIFTSPACWVESLVDAFLQCENRLPAKINLYRPPVAIGNKALTVYSYVMQFQIEILFFANRNLFGPALAWLLRSGSLSARLFSIFFLVLFVVQFFAAKCQWTEEDCTACQVHFRWGKVRGCSLRSVVRWLLENVCYSWCV